MKLVRYKSGTEERLGVISGDRIVDISGAYSGFGVSQSMREFLAGGADSLHAARAAISGAAGSDNELYSVPLATAALLAPVGDPQKIICIGQNYRDHCVEQNQPLPERAIIFAKFPSALIGPGANIVLPRISEQVDYEAELAFVIGKKARHVAEADAKEYIAGYMCLNDVSARDIQFSDKQWVRGKTFDTFAPTGPALVTADEIEDPHNLDIQLTLNGNVMQKSNTSNLIFGVYHLVSYLSAAMTLEPGDIVTTGTPGGVGIFRNPPVLLKPGDAVSVTIQGLGTLTNSVAAE